MRPDRKGRTACCWRTRPYGERLGDADAVHADLAALLNRLDGWSAAVLTPHPAFASMVGRKAERRRKLYNGRLACTLHQYLGPKPPSRSPPPPAGPSPAPPAA